MGGRPWSSRICAISSAAAARVSAPGGGSGVPGGGAGAGGGAGSGGGAGAGAVVGFTGAVSSPFRALPQAQQRPPYPPGWSPSGSAAAEERPPIAPPPRPPPLRSLRPPSSRALQRSRPMRWARRRWSASPLPSRQLRRRLGLQPRRRPSSPTAGWSSSKRRGHRQGRLGHRPPVPSRCSERRAQLPSLPSGRSGEPPPWLPPRWWAWAAPGLGWAPLCLALPPWRRPVRSPACFAWARGIGTAVPAAVPTVAAGALVGVLCTGAGRGAAVAVVAAPAPEAAFVAAAWPIPGRSEASAIAVVPLKAPR